MRFNKWTIDDLIDYLKRIKMSRDYDSDYIRIRGEVTIENNYDSDVWSELAEQISD